MSIFAAQLKFIINGANSANKTETKLLGRRTGESPAVISKLRLGLGCSDLPSLFNFNPFFMQPKKDDQNGSCQACNHSQEPTIEQLLNNFFEWQSAESCTHELWEWLLVAIGSQEFDQWTPQKRANLAFLYKQLSDLLINLESKITN